MTTEPGSPKVVFPVFVITYPVARQREAIRQRLAPLGVAPRFFDAIRGSTLPESERQPFSDSGREYWFDGPMREGAMGCCLSHFGVWQQILDEGIEAAVVLEGDADAIDPGRSDVGAMLNALYGRRGQLDLVFLNQRFNRQIVRVDGSSEGEAGLTLHRYSDIGADSYFITNRCARYLLTRPERYRFEVDCFLQHWWRHDPDIHILHHHPPLFKEMGRPSEIDYATTPRYPSNPLHHLMMRRVHRIGDSMKKRWLFMRYASCIRERFARD